VHFAITLGTLNPRVWDEVVAEADRLGYESVWLPEHLVLPVRMEGSPFSGAGHPPIPPDVPVYDPFAYLGWVAARTRRIRLGTYVYNIGLRHPFVTARGAATVDRLSGGRLILGVGVGWLRAEWEAVGLDFTTRGRRVDEAIEVCRRLWTEPEVEHHGRFWDFGPVAFEPKPARPGGPPIHVGGDSPAALARVAATGDGWLPMNHTLADLPAALHHLAEVRATAGRPGRTEITVVAAGTPADVEAARELGVDRLLVRPWKRSAEAVEALARFRQEAADGWDEPRPLFGQRGPGPL
jgi:probable F420-dependent oxidoreductase